MNSEQLRAALLASFKEHLEQDVAYFVELVDSFLRTLGEIRSLPEVQA